MVHQMAVSSFLPNQIYLMKAWNLAYKRCVEVIYLTICHHISHDHIDGFVQESSNSIDMASKGQNELKWPCSSKFFFSYLYYE